MNGTASDPSALASSTNTSTASDIGVVSFGAGLSVAVGIGCSSNVSVTHPLGPSGFSCATTNRASALSSTLVYCTGRVRSTVDTDSHGLVIQLSKRRLFVLNSERLQRASGRFSRSHVDSVARLALLTRHHDFTGRRSLWGRRRIALNSVSRRRLRVHTLWIGRDIHVVAPRGWFVTSSSTMTISSSA